MKQIDQQHMYKLSLTGLFAALSYVVFTFLQIKIPLPGGDATSIHLGNAVCVLGSLLLGGVYGGLGGAIGMAIGDLFDPVYVIYAPRTVVLKLLLGLITGLVAHKIGKINNSWDERYLFKWCLLSSAASLGLNAVLAPIAGYYYKRIILGKPAAQITFAWNAVSSVITAVLSVVVCCILYIPLRKALGRAGVKIVIK